MSLGQEPLVTVLTPVYNGEDFWHLYRERSGPDVPHQLERDTASGGR